MKKNQESKNVKKAEPTQNKQAPETTSSCPKGENKKSKNKEH